MAILHNIVLSLQQVGFLQEAYYVLKKLFFLEIYGSMFIFTNKYRILILFRNL